MTVNKFFIWNVIKCGTYMNQRKKKEEHTKYVVRLNILLESLSQIFEKSNIMVFSSSKGDLVSIELPFMLIP